MTKSMRIGVVFGGKSGEHEVSMESAKSVMAALDPNRYELVPIAIDKQGRWHVGTAATALLAESGWSTQRTLASGDRGLQVRPGSVLPGPIADQIDVLLPVLHGTFGEDGSIQGLFELLNVPYVGAGVAASAVGMDKILMKRVFAAAGLPQVAFVETSRRTWSADPDAVRREVEQKLGYPCFVKPANLGSSVGISKVKGPSELAEAMSLAAQYDRRIIVEQGLDVREIEVAVLGNEQPRVSVPGEVLPSNEFYDYRAKYLDGNSDLVIPADVTDEQAEQIRAYAVRAFRAIDCAGLARVDFFIERASGRVLVNEINTMPGFTQFSMYPKLWEASGLPYEQLLDALIELALERHEDRLKTRHDFSN
ncbi:MAG: D-alanine--D-alanine ligase [Alicyclobacillus sp.]|nr:D-alanine--D-alanine ligase [Alicyclobacillus sp.]